MGRSVIKARNRIKDLVPDTARGDKAQIYQVQMDQKILGVLFEVGERGIKHVELAKKVGIDRKNLTPHMQRLVHQIKREKGQQGKYFLRKIIYGQTSGLLFGHKALRLLPRKPEDSMNSMIVRQMSKPFVNYTSIREFGPEAKKFGLARDLFEFSNVIGAYVLFVLIQAMNPDNKKLYENRKPTVDIAQRWSEKAILYIVPYLFSAFHDYIQFSLVQHLKFKSVDEYFSLMGNAKTVYDELIAYYAKLYPVMFTELGKMRKEFLA